MHNLAHIFNRLAGSLSDCLALAKENTVLGISSFVFFTSVYIFIGVIIIGVSVFFISAVFSAIRRRLDGTTKEESLRYEAADMKLADQLDALGASGDGRTRILEYPARSIRVVYHAERGKGLKWEGFTLTAKAAFPITGSVSIALRKPGRSGSFISSGGVDDGILTNDNQFDARFLVLTGDKAFADTYLASNKKRDAIQTLFGKRCFCDSIKLDKTGLYVGWRKRMGHCENVKFINLSLDPVAALVGEFQR